MSIVKKREWVYNGQTKSAWIVRYTDSDGKKRLKTFEFKKDADRYRLKVDTEIDIGSHIPLSQAKTVREVCRLFGVHSEERLKDGRIGRARFEILKNAINISIVPHLGGIKIKDVSILDIENWYRLIQQPRQSRTGIEQTLSPRTARERVYIYKQIEDFARKRGFLHNGIAILALQDLRGIDKPPIKTFKLDDIGQLFAALERRKWRGHDRTHAMLRCVTHLAAFCGLRKGEIFGLTLANVDLDERLLHVRHNLTAWDVLKSTKTRAGIRDEPIPRHLAAMLQDWIATHYVVNERQLLFRNHLRAGFITSAHWHNALWHPLLKAADLWQEDGDQLHFHALRHFKASWMAHNGIPFTEIAESMGHASFDTTLQVYAHTLIPARGRRERMDDLSNTLLLTAGPSGVEMTRSRQGAENDI